MLFNKRLLQTHLNSFEFPQGLNFERVSKIIHNWQESIRNGNYDKTKEKYVDKDFLIVLRDKILSHWF